MATTIEQQTALDESLVPSTQRLRIGRSNFRLPSDIQSKKATLQVVYDVLRNSPLFRAFQIDTRKSVLDLEAFREMLHISPRIPNQPFADLPTEEEILYFLRLLGYSHDIRYLTDVNVNKLYQPWRSFASVINYKAYKEYHACAMGEAAPKPKASAKKKKGDSASSTTPPTPTPTTTVEYAPRLSATAKGKQPSRATAPVEPTDIQRTEAEQLKIVQKRSRQETHISQQSGFEEELSKDDGEDKKTSKGGDEVRESEGESDEEKTREEEDENFDPIPRTPEESEEESNDEEEQEPRLSEEVRIQEEEDADELYREAPIPPPTIPSIIPENLPTFNSAFRFEERLRLLETSFSEY
nr:hypothetical protein [Tanacetum cinerariifolium]